MITLAELHETWRGKANRLDSYESADPLRSQMIVEEIGLLNLVSPSILEIGCNVGRNLLHLYQAGYSRLSGIDLNEEAVCRARLKLPQLCNPASIQCSTIEDIIRTYNANEFDVVFTMAVLMHVHPDSEWVFAEIARITRSYLLVFEMEEPGAAKSGRFIRDYREVFTRYSMECVKVLDGPDIDRAFGEQPGYRLRVFHKTGGEHAGE